MKTNRTSNTRGQRETALHALCGLSAPGQKDGERYSAMSARKRLTVCLRSPRPVQQKETSQRAGSLWSAPLPEALASASTEPVGGGLWKGAIQEYLVSAIQNIETLIRHAIKPTKGVRTAPFATLGRAVRAYINVYLFYCTRQAPDAGLTDLAFL